MRGRSTRAASEDVAAVPAQDVHLRFALGELPAQLEEIRRRIAREPNEVAREERLAVGTDAFEAPPSRAHALQLSRLRFCLGAHFRCPCLPRLAPKPRAIRDPRYTERDGFLYDDVGQVLIHRCHRGSHLVEVGVACHQQHVRERFRPCADRVRGHRRIIHDERLGQHAEPCFDDRRVLQRDIFEAACDEVRPELILEPQQRGVERAARSDQVTRVPHEPLLRVPLRLLGLPRRDQLLSDDATSTIEAGAIMDGRAHVLAEATSPRIMLAPFGLTRLELATPGVELFLSSLSAGEIRARRPFILLMLRPLGLSLVEERAHNRGLRAAKPSGLRACRRAAARVPVARQPFGPPPGHGR